jgi:hypothetical protein
MNIVVLPCIAKPGFSGAATASNQKHVSVFYFNGPNNLPVLYGLIANTAACLIPRYEVCKPHRCTHEPAFIKR